MLYLIRKGEGGGGKITLHLSGAQVEREI